jgi:hypothetical protein
MKNPVLALFSNARFPYPYSMFHDKPRSLGGFGDELGFRNPHSPLIPKPAGEKRIFMLGNSAVHSLPAPSEPNLPLATQQAFHERGQAGVKVYNYGIESGNSGQSLMLFLDQLIDLQPDLVIAYDGATDLIVPFHYDPRPGYTFNNYILEVIHEAIAEDKLADLNIVKSERERRELIRKRVNFGSSDWRESLAAAYVNRVAKFCHLARCFGIKFVHIMQAVYRKNLPAEAEKRIAAQTEFLAFGYDMFERAAGGIRGLKHQFSDSNCFRFDDFSRAFIDEPEHRFKDWAHVNGIGNRIVAGMIADLTYEMVAQ